MERWVLKNISLGRLSIAIILAVVVWGYVITTQYPEDSITYNSIPVTITGLAGNLVARPFTPQTVKVTINGSKAKVSYVQLSAIKPTLDLSVFTRPGTFDVKIKLDPSPDNVTNYIIEPDTIRIQIEEFVSKDLDVLVNKVGTVRSGYQQPTEIKLSTGTVKINGPKSLVDRIAKAQVTVNLDDRDSNLQALALPVILLDSQGQAVTDKSIQLEPSIVSVSAAIAFQLNTKTVPIRVVTAGSPASGYIAGSSITTNPSLITLTGDPAVLSPIEYVETKPVNLTNASSNISTTVGLQIPENTALDMSKTTVEVQIGITAATASVPVTVVVEALNPPANLRYQINPKEVSITLQGPYNMLQPKLPLDQIKATVDLAGHGEGTFQTTVSVQTPPGLVPNNVPQVTVIISALPRPTPTATPTPTHTPLPTPTSIPSTPTPASTNTITAPPTTTVSASGLSPASPSTAAASPAANSNLNSGLKKTGSEGGKSPDSTTPSSLAIAPLPSTPNPTPSGTRTAMPSPMAAGYDIF